MLNHRREILIMLATRDSVRCLFCVVLLSLTLGFCMIMVTSRGLGLLMNGGHACYLLLLFRTKGIFWLVWRWDRRLPMQTASLKAYMFWGVLFRHGCVGNYKLFIFTFRCW
jgi:hypothetical protein